MLYNTHYLLQHVGLLIATDPRAARPYLFSDRQNMYNRVVLVCTVNYTYPLAWVDANFQVGPTTGTLGDVWPLRLIWELTKYTKIAPYIFFIYIQILDVFFSSFCA